MTEGGGMSISREQAAAARRKAMEARAPVEGEQAQARLAEQPAGVGMARVSPFRAELRAKLEDRHGQQMYHLDGHATVWNTRYEMWDMFGPYEEQVADTAGDKTLAADPDVAYLVNHKGVTMARTTAKTLELAKDETGLAVDAWLNPKRTDVKDLVFAIEDRSITEMSFAFMLEQGRWNEEFTLFTITEFNIDRGDVSAVNYGANPFTDVAARAREVLADIEHLPVGAAREAMDRLARRWGGGLDPAPVLEAARDESPRPKLPLGRSITLVQALLDDE